MTDSIDRKKFIVAGAQALLSLAGFQVAFAEGGRREQDAHDQSARDILVYVFLRGGCDGLNFVAPTEGDDRKIYEQERPTLKMPVDGPDKLLRLTGPFGLHPSARPLWELYQTKKLAVIHGAGIPSNNRSHFDAQNIVELGVGEKKVMGSGWLARTLASARTPASVESKHDPNVKLPAVSIGGLSPTSLLSFEAAITLDDPRGLNLLGDKAAQQEQIAALQKIYGVGTTGGSCSDCWMRGYGEQVLHTLGLFDSRPGGEYVPSKNIEYPKGDIGNRMKVLAQILKMDLGVQAATVDMGGWDTHKFQGAGAEGQFSNNVTQLAAALAAFYSDMDESNAQSRGKRLTILVMSEFGRRLRENANRGTDHGHGGVMFAIGENVAGGKVYGKWPGLRTDQLYERADLAVTTDYRLVLTELIQKRFKLRNTKEIFPGFHSENSSPRELGVFQI